MTIYSEGKSIKVSGSGSSSDVYSTEETRIGIWDDGKPIYRRVFQGIIPSTNSVVASIGDRAQPIKLTTMLSDSGGDWYTVGLGSNTPGAYIGANGDIYIQPNGGTRPGSPFHVIVEYTKIADPVVSGTGSVGGYISYDTDDGWHVRKWDDGYVEMSIQKQTNVGGFNNSSTGSRFGLLMESIALPLTLTRKLSERVDILKNTCPGDVWPGTKNVASDELTYTNTYAIYASSSAVSSGTDFRFSVIITGLWK